MQRYPPRGGLECTPFALEVFGRMSNDCIELLDGLAAVASERDALRDLPVRAWERIWLQKLSVTLQRSVSQSILECIGMHIHE